MTCKSICHLFPFEYKPGRGDRCLTMVCVYLWLGVVPLLWEVRLASRLGPAMMDSHCPSPALLETLRSSPETSAVQRSYDMLGGFQHGVLTQLMACAIIPQPRSLPTQCSSTVIEAGHWSWRTCWHRRVPITPHGKERPQPFWFLSQYSSPSLRTSLKPACLPKALPPHPIILELRV